MANATVAVVDPSTVEEGGLFTACAQCALLGAEMEIPNKPGRYVCSEICATAVSNSGIPANAVPSAVPVKSSMLGIIYKCSLLNPVHIVDAAQWLAVGGTESIAARVAGLHSGMIAYNASRGGPYSHLPMPLDPQLYNAAMAWARRYAQIALTLIPAVREGAVMSKEAIEKLRDTRAVSGESDADLNVMTLWYVYATFWRRYLYRYDWASYCDLSEADRAKTSHMRPDFVPSPDTASNAVISQDTGASLRRLELAVQGAVKLLFDLGFTRDLIQASLINGLFADVTPGEFDIRSPDTKSADAGTPDQVIRVEESSRLIEHALTGNDEQFIRAVTDSHASIGSWVRARFNRAVGRAKGFTSRVGYSWVTLADRLYQLALANKCDRGMIAGSAQLAIEGLWEATTIDEKSGKPKPKPITSDASFVVAYQAALAALASATKPEDAPQPNWASRWGTLTAAALEIGKTGAGRDDRIQSYTCSRSSAGKLAPSVWRTLPSDIAAQVYAMGKYLSMSDLASGATFEKRNERVKSDIKELVKELVRKVGTWDAGTILLAITPVAK